MEKLKVVIVGLGERGRIHLHGFLQNPDKFEVVGLCDHKEENIQKALTEFGLSKELCYPDAEEMLQMTKPDILTFVTMPRVRLSLVKLAVKYQVKGLMFEKPMATSLEEAAEITRLCEENHIKTVVCQQHKYLRSFRKLKEVLDSGELGEIYEMKASCQAQASQLGTHYIDYLIWANGGRPVLSVTGHVHGNFYLEDSHPSPDFVMGRMIFENGVRALFECGYLSRKHADHHVEFTHGSGEDAYWTDDYLTVFGSKGYAYAACNGQYGVFSRETAPEIRMGDYQDFFKKEQYDAQVVYTSEFADWVNGIRENHPCNIGITYHGYEVLEAMYVSAIERTRVDLPLKLPMDYDTLEVLKKELKPVTCRKI